MAYLARISKGAYKNGWKNRLIGGGQLKLKEFRTTHDDKVLIDIDSISSVYEAIINGRCAAVVVMQQGESYTLDMSVVTVQSSP